MADEPKDQAPGHGKIVLAQATPALPPSPPRWDNRILVYARGWMADRTLSYATLLARQMDAALLGPDPRPFPAQRLPRYLANAGYQQPYQGHASNAIYFGFAISDGHMSNQVADILAEIRDKAGLDATRYPITNRNQTGLVEFPFRLVADYGNGPHDFIKALREHPRLTTLLNESAANKIDDFWQDRQQYVSELEAQQTLDLTSGDLKLSEPLKQEAIGEAIKAIAAVNHANTHSGSTTNLAKTQEFRYFAAFDGNPNELSIEEAAAAFVAMSASRQHISPSTADDPNPVRQVTVGGTFETDAMWMNDRDRALLVEIGRQIYGDTFGNGIAGGRPTEGPEGNKPLIDIARRDGDNGIIKR